jgi:hypothetical protein
MDVRLINKSTGAVLGNSDGVDIGWQDLQSDAV